MGKSKRIRNRKKHLAEKNATKDRLAGKYLDPKMKNVDLYPIASKGSSHLTFDGLRKANEHAIATDKNRALWEHVIDAQDRGHRFPVLAAYVHNNREIRMGLVFIDPNTHEPTSGWIDVDFDVFDEIEVRDFSPMKAA